MGHPWPEEYLRWRQHWIRCEKLAKEAGVEDNIVHLSQDETGTQDKDLEEQENLKRPSVKWRFDSFEVHHY